MSPEELKLYWAGVLPVIPVELEYRLHYNEVGNIVLCTMTDHPADTNYIIVDKDTYNNYFHYYVKNSKLIKIDNSPKYSVQLTKSESGYPTVSGHASLLIEEEEYTNIEYYATRNN